MRYIFILLIMISLAGCSGTISIQQNEKFKVTKADVPKIICIAPRFYYENDDKNYDLKKYDKLNSELRKDIVRYAKKNKLNVELREFDEKADIEFYESLIRLRNNMLAENFNQETPLNFTRSVKRNSIQKTVLVYPPKISHEFATFSKRFSTPYFSYLGIYHVNGKIVLYHVMVDTDKCETVYREVKTVKSKKVNTNTMAQLVFDSYAMLKMQLK